MGARSGQHHDTGSIVGGTVSGAASGAAVGGPYGAVVGGAVGLLSGILSGGEPDPLPEPPKPPPPEDLADLIAQRGAIAQQMRLLADGASNFVSGPGGDTSDVPGSAPRAKAA